MELFKFNFTTDPTVLERGEAINGAKSIMWAERYSDSGEFEITSQLSSGLREFLPLGTLISHIDTLEVMIVENHEISEDNAEDPTLTITGRSFDSYLDNRIVGLAQARANSTVTEYALTPDWIYNQVVKLINDHIYNANVNDNLVNVVATTLLTSTTGVNEARSLKRGSLLKQVRELLAIEDLGLKTIRRNTFGVEGSPMQTIMSVYKGVNRSATVSFSWKAGDLDSTEYLFSNKKLKNSALVQGRYVNTVVDLGPTKYERRIMLVDASDIDGNLGAPPTGGTLTTVLQKMTTRGQQELMSQKNVTISRTDISDTTKYRYRKDYNVGDLISLDGNFGIIATMRVVEFVEIEDENGESGHPTLAVPAVIS